MRAYAAGVRGQELGALTKLDLAVSEIMQHVKRIGGPWDLSIRGSDETERVHGDARIRRRITALGKDLHVGDRLDLIPINGRRLFVIRCSEWRIGDDLVPDFPPVTHTPEVERIWRTCYVKTEQIAFRLGRNLAFVQQGVFNCRKIDGSDSWSKHAWGAALDGHVANADTGRLDGEATDLLVAILRPLDFVGLVLWRVSGHFGHFHAEEDDPPSGFPPCAR